MGGGGGKGGEQTTRIELPPELEAGAIGALGGALRSASMPYRPNRGATIAAFSPQQMAAFQGADQAASAFGLPTSGGQQYLPAPEQTAGGFLGYSTGDLYDQNIERSMSDEDMALREAILQGYADVSTDVLGNPAFAAARRSMYGGDPLQQYYPTGMETNNMLEAARQRYLARDPGGTGREGKDLGAGSRRSGRSAPEGGGVSRG